jgi:hypothetical protein
MPPAETGTRKQRSWALYVLDGCIVRVHHFIAATDVVSAKAEAAKVLGYKPRWEPFGFASFTAPMKGTAR